MNTLIGETPKTGNTTGDKPAAPGRPAPPDLAATVSLGDTVKNSGAQPVAALDSGLKSVQSQLAPTAAPLTGDEIRRLLSGPATLNKIQSLLQRDPALKREAWEDLQAAMRELEKLA